MRIKPIIFLAIICSSLIACSSVNTTNAGPLISKPEFRGRVIDAETKEPIEGAVVVVMYYKSPVISGPAGGSSSIVKVKETLTDANGEFHFPKYKRLLSPISDDGGTDWIIYKPGYASYPTFESRIYPLNQYFWGPEIFFADKFGEKEEIQKDGNVVTVTFGEVELPKLKTKKERLRAFPSTSADFSSKEAPLLYKVINEENTRYGLGESY